MGERTSMPLSRDLQSPWTVTGTPKCCVQISRMDSSGILTKTLEDLNLFLYYQGLKSRSHMIYGNLELTLADAASAVVGKQSFQGPNYISSYEANRWHGLYLSAHRCRKAALFLS